MGLEGHARGTGEPKFHPFAPHNDANVMDVTARTIRLSRNVVTGGAAAPPAFAASTQ
jgi:hypothetical protein